MLSPIPVSFFRFFFVLLTLSLVVRGIKELKFEWLLKEVSPLDSVDEREESCKGPPAGPPPRVVGRVRISLECNSSVI